MFFSPGRNIMHNHPEQRRQKFVNWKIQGTLLTRLATYAVLYHLILWNVMFLHRYLQYRGEMQVGGRAQTFLELYGNFANQNISMIICAVCLLPVLMWDGLRFSHWIAGPLVRVQSVLKDLSQGHRSGEIALRKDDLAVQLVESVNELLRSQRIQTSEEIVQRQQAENPVMSDEEQELLEELHKLHTVLDHEAVEEGIVADAALKVDTPPPSSSRSSQILLKTEEKWS